MRNTMGTTSGAGTA